jgi:GMP synthase-like glutamine amidotransferase
VIGVCLGAQLLAAAMGARVYKGTSPEVGFGEVELTEPGRGDPVLASKDGRLRVFHWHGDTFDLPRDAVHLARSQAYPHQAFRVGRRAYALQFHVELDQALARAWAPDLPPHVSLDEETRSTVERQGRLLIRRFFDLAKG